MKISLQYLLLMILVLIGSQRVSSAEDNRPVIYLRTCVELLNNQGTSPGSTTNIGGFSLTYFVPLTTNLMAGFGYSSSFDISNQTLPVAGYSFHGKWYFWGQGTTVIHKESWGSSESRSTTAYYIGSSFVYNTYFLGHDPSSSSPKDNLSGHYSNINAYVGTDYAINKKFSWNAEGGMSLLTLAASDNRVKIQSSFIYMGLSYVFN